MPGDDIYSAQQRKRVDPGFGAYAITPNNSNNLNPATRAIYVGGGGNLNVMMLNGETVLFTGVLAGSILPICVSRVLLTSTTATNLVGLY